MKNRRASMQREELLVQLLREQGDVKLDEQQMRVQREAIMRKIRTLQADRSVSWVDRLKEWVAVPKYGLALLLLILAFVQISGLNSVKPDNAVFVEVSTPSVEESVEDEVLDVYPDLPENLRLFAPPTGGDGTVLPAEFERK